MSDRHLTRDEILAVITGASQGHAVSWEHIEHCDVCWEEYEQLATSEAFSIVMRSTLEHVDEGLDSDFSETWRWIEDEEERTERDAREADALFLRLAQHSPDEWDEIIGANPNVCTAALVQRLVAAAGSELDRKPDHALALLSIAETVAYTLRTEEVSLRSRGHVWKQRSNAYRMTGRYEDAIDAAYVASQLYAELRSPDSDFEIGQARYAMAATLTKMTRFSQALQTLANARSLLEEYGESLPLAKAMILEAAIRLEQGAVVSARDTLRAILPITERLGERLETGRLRLNIAECNLRLGELEAARDDAQAATEIFTAVGNVAERARSEWTLIMTRLAQGETQAVSELEPIAALFERLGMPGEAGFVALDRTEVLLQSGDWTEAERLARELVPLFTAAGVTLAGVNALHFLRAAVKNHEATVETIRYVRTYLAADDPEQVFAPPEFGSN